MPHLHDTFRTDDSPLQRYLRTATPLHLNHTTIIRYSKLFNRNNLFCAESCRHGVRSLFHPRPVVRIGEGGTACFLNDKIYMVLQSGSLVRSRDVSADGFQSVQHSEQHVGIPAPVLPDLVERGITKVSKRRQAVQHAHLPVLVGAVRRGRNRARDPGQADAEAIQTQHRGERVVDRR